jgi:hypothetical protein
LKFGWNLNTDICLMHLWKVAEHLSTFPPEQARWDLPMETQYVGVASMHHEIFTGTLN